LPVVTEIAADRFGGLMLTMTGGYSLEVFPATSFAREHWRYLEHGVREHFVVFER
jgi:hypothetical protein